MQATETRYYSPEEYLELEEMANYKSEYTYRTIPTFQEYLLIDQTRIYVEQYFRVGKKQWSLREYDEEEEEIALQSVSFQISLLDLYNKVIL